MRIKDNKAIENNRSFSILGRDIFNKYNQEGITDQEFIVYCIERITKIKEVRE